MTGGCGVLSADGIRNTEFRTFLVDLTGIEPAT